MRSKSPAPEAGDGRRAGGRAKAHALRTPARVILFAICLFIVYGSLFPFDFTSQPLPLDSFLAENDLFKHQTDALDNFFLFVPLGVALHASFQKPAARIVGVILSVVVLAVGIQLVQLYLPSRTASLTDAVWNTIGLGAGLLVAERVRQVLGTRLAAASARRESFLLCLVGIWFCYESFPFVPTLDIGLLREHVKTAVFAPPFEPMRLTQHALAAALAAIALMRSGWLRRPRQSLVLLGALALALEVCVAYGNLRRETLLGIVLGLGLGGLAAQYLRQRVAILALGLALCTYLITVLTPYRGQSPGAAFQLVPFSRLLWDGVVGDLPAVAFEALAIGTMLWAGLGLVRGRPALWCSLVLALLAVLEWVRVALVGYHGDTTSLVMALVLAPAAAALYPVPGALEPETGGESMSGRAAEVVAQPATDPKAGPALAQAAGAAAVLAVAPWVLVHLAGIPYNLANLFGEHVLWGAAVFSLALLWLGGGVWAAAHAVLRLEARRREGALWLPLLLIGIALVSFVLVNVATPEIMLNKIIGAPDLYRRIVDENYWGDAWRSALAAWPRGLVEQVERVVRYVALYAVFMIPLAVGLLGVPRQGRRARLIVGIACLLPCWVLAKYVVLDWAITDNLTELVVEGGSFWLAGVLALFGANVATVVAYAGRPRSFALLAGWTLALTGASWWLFGQAIESIVINNGRVFNGVQFLLGENRTALLSDWALFGRWCALYLGATAVVVGGVLLAMRALPEPRAPQPLRRAHRGAARTRTPA